VIGPTPTGAVERVDGARFDEGERGEPSAPPPTLELLYAVAVAHRTDDPSVPDEQLLLVFSE